ncbi:MAG: AAA family ATPase [Verrucomicrobiaceae bacterium]
MKIDYLKVRSPFKNLEGVLVDFDEDHLMTVIVGSNGSGKSNVLEALVSIFRNLDLKESPLFSYEIKYRLQTTAEPIWITVDADPEAGKTPDKQYKILAGPEGGEQEKLRISQVARNKEGEAPYLPQHLFAYYSGPSDRLEKYFRKHRTDFYNKLLKSDLNLRGNIRPLFYAKPIHSQFVLLAFYLTQEQNTEQQFLFDHLGIESLDSVHLVMRRPSWSNTPQKRNELFWSAGGVVREFLDLLFPHTLAPLKITREEDVGLTKGNPKNEFFHLFIPTLNDLRAFASDLGPDVFFKMLESTLLSEVISEINIRVKMKGSNETLSFNELSEGEQQLLTVLGLLKFTGAKDTLFLLDEPDTHLNPAWAKHYLSYLDTFTPDKESSQLLMVTHHPLAIAELEKEQVQVMRMEHTSTGPQVKAYQPEESPRGLGYSGILMSDMFGLKSDIDDHTLNKMHRRAALAAQETLSREELEELTGLNAYLDHLGYASLDSDPHYREYLRTQTVRDHEPA